MYVCTSIIGKLTFGHQRVRSLLCPSFKVSSIRDSCVEVNKLKSVSLMVVSIQSIVNRTTCTIYRRYSLQHQQPESTVLSSVSSLPHSTAAPISSPPPGWLRPPR